MSQEGVSEPTAAASESNESASFDPIAGLLQSTGSRGLIACIIRAANKLSIGVG